MTLFCSICIDECNIDSNEINLFNEMYALKLLKQICDSNQMEIGIQRLQHKFVKLNCNHVFHITCLLKYFEYNSCYCVRCPMCREFIKMEFMVHMRRLYIRFLNKEITRLHKTLVKNKLKKTVYKTILYIKNNRQNALWKEKLETVLELDIKIKGEKSSLEKIVSALLLVKHKPCRMAIDIYTRYSVIE